jgi:large subunit ribosomal protein LP0
MQGVATVAAVSLEIGYPTMASAPHSIVNGMKNLLAIAAVTDITFKVPYGLSSHISQICKES